LEILTTVGPIAAVGVLAKVILKFTGLFSQIGAVVYCCVLNTKTCGFHAGKLLTSCVTGGL
jgi:hypothetical protein